MTSLNVCVWPFVSSVFELLEFMRLTAWNFCVWPLGISVFVFMEIPAFDFTSLLDFTLVLFAFDLLEFLRLTRSDERGVGHGSRSRWSPDHQKLTYWNFRV